MENIKKFDEFLNNKKVSDIKQVAGVAVTYKNKILLVHPTNGTWKIGICGIPKGKIEEDDENEMEAAIRELKEETGIEINKDQLDQESHSIDIYNKNGHIYKQLTYFICNISQLSEIGLDDIKIPKDQLQLEEVDWAKFINIEEAYKLITKSQLIILDRLR